MASELKMASAFFLDRRSPSSSSLARGRPTRKPAHRRQRLPVPARRRAGGLLGRELARGRCSGSTARAGARRGPVGRRACGPGAVAVHRSSSRPQTPCARRSASRPGRPASTIAAWTAAMSYGDAMPASRPRRQGRGCSSSRRVAVARLADAAGVEQGPHAGDGQLVAVARPDHGRCDRPSSTNATGTWVWPFRPWLVARASNDAARDRRGRQVLPGRVARAAVDEGHVAVGPDARAGRGSQSRVASEIAAASTPWPRAPPG